VRDLEQEKKSYSYEQHHAPRYDEGTQLARLRMNCSWPVHSLRSCQQNTNKCRIASDPNETLTVADVAEGGQMISDARNDAADNNQYAIYYCGR
jgi:hypothetical protein